ncbi:hypothetical protein [Mycobacterium marinum]|uniref:hypothetical protein n=3 Tax=Mycobacterium marinum TaxID=1781 RepID=UPI003563BCCD
MPATSTTHRLAPRPQPPLDTKDQQEQPDTEVGRPLTPTPRHMPGFKVHNRIQPQADISSVDRRLGEAIRHRLTMLHMISTRVIGVGEYHISNEQDGVINARYLSTAAMKSGGAIGVGRARGDTSNGFPGDYRAQYFDAAGDLTGDLDLRIQRSGATYRLTWRHRRQNVSLPAAVGEVIFEGIGFPSGDRSMAVSYWMTEQVSAAIERRPLL